MADVLQTGISGLLAYQRALATTGHNISNANTAGYNRQRVDFSTNVPQMYGTAWIGSGVQVSGVNRVIDDARQASVRSNTTDYKSLEIFSEFSGRLDNLLADKSAGLSPALQGLFDAVQQVANDPTSQTSRQVLLSEGENLVSRFKFLDSRFNELERDINQRMTVHVEEINQYAEGIAKLNREIALALGRSGGSPPNDLLDKRDHLVTELSQRVATRVVMQDDGSMNVSIGNGQALVVGQATNRLVVTHNEFDRSRTEIALVSGSSTINMTRHLNGGSLGGLLDFRTNVLDPSRNQLGQLAATVATEFNEQHKLGMRFDTTPPSMGGNFFNVQQPKILAREHNSGGISGSPVVGVDPTQLGELKGSDYRLTYDAGADVWNLRRLSDGETVQVPVDAEAFEFDGMIIDVSGIDNPASLDAFLIQPTRDTVSQLDLAISRAEQVAAATPVVTGEAVDETGQSVNSGSGRIGPATVTSGDNLPLTGTIELEFDPAMAPSGGFTVMYDGVPLDSIPYDPVANVDGIQVSLTQGGDDFGVEFTLAGVPREGDTFVISPNQDGRGDNGNMLALGQLAERASMVNGNSTYQEFYSGIVGSVGATTMRANINRDAQQILMNQAIASHESVSGVNLDEEAANLMRFQQAYQASAQMITASETMFQALMNAIRR